MNSWSPVPSAEKRLNDVIIEEEEECWGKTQSINTKIAYKNYLKKYPRGRYRLIADKEINKLTPKKVIMRLVKAVFILAFIGGILILLVILRLWSVYETIPIF